MATSIVTNPLSRKLVAGTNHAFFAVLLLVPLGIVLGAVFLRLVFAGKGCAPKDLWPAALAVMLCLIPGALSFALAHTMRHSRESRFAVAIPEGELPSRSDLTVPEVDAWRAALRAAAQHWKHESATSEQILGRFIRHSLIYGFALTLSLGVVALLAGEVILGTSAESSPRTQLGIAIGTAVVVVFARDFGQMTLRVAGRDGGAGMFAWATRRLLVVVSGTIILAALLSVLRLAPEANVLPFPVRTLGYGSAWAALGAAMATLGERAYDATASRLGVLVGVSPRRPPADSGLRRVEGVLEADLERLAEEGITSVHALAFVSIPRLYFTTAYSLQRLCDWQDQALLIVRLGENRARLCSEQLGIRSAVVLQRIAADAIANRLPAEEVDDLGKLLSVARGAPLRALLDEFARDELVHRVAMSRLAKSGGVS